MANSVTIRQLRAFIAVARQGSFTKAATAVRVSQPTLTMSVQALEESISLRLFDRDTRNVKLTEAGRQFLAIAERLVAEFDDAIEGARQKGAIVSGRVAVACLASVASSVLGPILRKFAAAHPGIVIRLLDGADRSIVERVYDRQADFGIGSRPIESAEIQFEALIKDLYYAVLPKGHRLASQKNVALQQLEASPFVAFKSGTGLRQILDAALSKVDCRINIACEVEQLTTVKALVEIGLGISAVPSFCIPAIQAENIVTRLIVDPNVEREIGIITRQGPSLPPAAERLRRMIRSGIRAVDSERKSARK